MSRRPSPFRAASLSPNREDSGVVSSPHHSSRGAPLDPAEISHIVSDVDDALQHLCAGLVQFAHILERLRHRGAAAASSSASGKGGSGTFLAPAPGMARSASASHQPRLMTVVCTTNQKFWAERRQQLHQKAEDAARLQDGAERDAALLDTVAVAIASIGHQFEDVLEDAKDVIRPPIPLSQRPSLLVTHGK